MSLLRFDVNDAELREAFFQSALLEALAGVQAEAKPAWGRMTAQQMLEHLEGMFGASLGRPELGCTLPEAKRERYKRFLYDDTPMPHDIENPVLVAGLPPLRHPDLPEALAGLRLGCEGFLEWARSAPGELHTHPVFGPIAAEEWSRSHYKHARHHLLQLGLV